MFFFVFFFYLGFLSRIFTIHGTAGEGGGYVFNSSLPLPPASQRLRHQPDEICFGVVIRNITFTKASCTNVIDSGEKSFCSCHFEKFVSHFFSDRIKKLVAYFGLLSISREEMRSKFMRRKFSFLYVNIYFDVQNIQQ